MTLQQLSSNMNSTLTRSSKESHACTIVTLPTPRHLITPIKATRSSPLIRQANTPLFFSSLSPSSFLILQHKQSTISEVTQTILHTDCSELNRPYIFAPVFRHVKTNAAYYETKTRIKFRPETASTWLLAALPLFLCITCFIPTCFHLVLGTP